jgi:ankyrin repeat protein
MEYLKHTPRVHANDVTGLMIACLHENYDQVVYQVEKLKVNINHQKNDGSTALMIAIYKKNLKIVKYLCENGADKELRDYLNNTALIYAIYLSPECASYLIIHGSHINIKNNLNETPMHFAAMTGNLFIVKLLFERGSELNVFNKNKHAPLMMACGNKHFDVIKFLVSNGADINVVDDNQDNILHCCIHHNMYNALLFLLNNKNLNVLDSKNIDNISPLMYAIKKNKHEYVELLLKYGANPNVHCPELTKVNIHIQNLLLKYKSEDILYHFITNDQYDLFTKYLKVSEINKENNNGETLLFFCTKHNKLKFVKVLLELGADPNINTLYTNQSPLYHAIINNNYQMVKLLLEYKADYNNRLYQSSMLTYYERLAKNSIHFKDGYRLSESIFATAIRYCGGNSKIYKILQKLDPVLFYEYDY